MIDIQDIAAIYGIIDDDAARSIIQDGDNLISDGGQLYGMPSTMDFIGILDGQGLNSA